MDLMYVNFIYLIFECTCMANSYTCSQIGETENSINIKNHEVWMNSHTWNIVLLTSKCIYLFMCSYILLCIGCMQVVSI